MQQKEWDNSPTTPVAMPTGMPTLKSQSWTTTRKQRQSQWGSYEPGKTSKQAGTEILKRYWHTKKDAWHNIFVCQCCACTNHTEQALDPLPTAETQQLQRTRSTPDHLPRKRQDPDAETYESKQDNSAGNKPEYPDSEIDD